MVTLTEKQKQDRRDAQRRWRERNPEIAKLVEKNLAIANKSGT